MADPAERSAPSCCQVTLLTPAGRAAVATLHLSGDATQELVEAFFQPASGRPFASYASGDVVFGYWQHASQSREEVVVARDDHGGVEVHCHGGVAASAAIRQSLLSRDAVELSGQQWLDRHVSSPIVAEAWLALAHAQTRRVARILLDQLQGAWAREVDALQGLLRAGQLASAAARINELSAWGDFGLHLTTPWRLVLAGPPNVGKSRLLNALVGFERAIVYARPGTTRDVVSTRTALDGWPLELTDTAGVHSSEDELELEGIRRTRDELVQADLVLLIDDLQKADRVQPSDLGVPAEKVLLVANKLDLVTSLPGLRPGELALSAVTGEGLDRLTRHIIHRLVPDAPAAGQAVPFAPRHREALLCIGQHCQHGQSAAALDALRQLS